MKTALRQLRDAFWGLSTEIWILSAVSLINRFGTTVVAFLTIYLTNALKMSIADAGFVMSSFGVGTLFGQYSGGKATDIVGFRRVQIVSLTAHGIFLLVAMQLRDFWSLSAALFVCGFFADAFRPANAVAIQYYSDDASRTRAFSLMRVGVNLSIGLGLVLGGFLANIQWSYLFLVDAVTCFAAAIMLIIYLKPPAKKAENTPQISENTPPLMLSASSSRRHDSIARKSPYKDPHLLAFVFLTFIGALVFMQIVYAAPKFFEEKYHWGAWQLGLISALNCFIVTFVELPLVMRYDNKKSKLWLIQIGVACYAVSYIFLFFPLSGAWLWAISYMFFISIGEILVMPFSTSWVSLYAKTGNRGENMALYGIAYSTNNIFAPIFATQIITHAGFDTLWTVLIAFSIVAIIGFRWLERYEAA